MCFIFFPLLFFFFFCKVVNFKLYNYIYNNYTNIKNIILLKNVSKYHYSSFAAVA